MIDPASFERRESDGEGRPRCDPLLKLKPKKCPGKHQCRRGPTFFPTGTVQTDSLNLKKSTQKSFANRRRWGRRPKGIDTNGVRSDRRCVFRTNGVHCKGAVGGNL
jgi:hypothetical protein